jgi:hypothetical protein
LSKSILYFKLYAGKSLLIFFYLLLHKAASIQTRPLIELILSLSKSEGNSKKEFRCAKTGTPLQLQTVSKETLLALPKAGLS